MLHEVKPVISGYRVVLTYNLILDDPSFRPSASTDNDELLKRLVDSYVDAVDEEESVPPELIYQLKHMYTEANMCVELLKLSDKEAALSLRKAAGSRCDIYLALLERQVEGACDDGDPHWRGGGTGEMYDINSDIITLKQITTFDGDEGAALEFMQDYGLNMSCAALHERYGRYVKAAELHMLEGDRLEAARLFLLDSENADSSARKAAECVLGGLWQYFSLSAAEANMHEPMVEKLLGLAELAAARLGETDSMYVRYEVCA